MLKEDITFIYNFLKNLSKINKEHKIIWWYETNFYLSTYSKKLNAFWYDDLILEWHSNYDIEYNNVLSEEIFLIFKKIKEENINIKNDFYYNFIEWIFDSIIYMLKYNKDAINELKSKIIQNSNKQNIDEFLWKKYFQISFLLFGNNSNSDFWFNEDFFVN